MVLMKSRIKRHGDCIEIKLVNSTSTGEQLHHETIYDLFNIFLIIRYAIIVNTNKPPLIPIIINILLINFLTFAILIFHSSFRAEPFRGGKDYSRNKCLDPFQHGSIPQHKRRFMTQPRSLDVVSI